MRRPVRNLLYVVLGFACVALLVQGAGLKLPVIMRALTAVTATAPSSATVVQGRAELSGGAAVPSADLTDNSCTGLSSIESSFNSTAIGEGNTIWFNSAIHVDGAGSDGATIFLKDSAITFAANGTNYRLAVPAAAISFDPGATSASTSFDAANNRWVTIVPGGYSGRTFLSGLAFPVPAGGLPGGISSVTWSAAISADKAGVTAQWGWGAAVYTTFETDYNALGINPVERVRREPGRQDALQQRERSRRDGFRGQAGESGSLRDRRRGWRRSLRFHGIGDDGCDERRDALPGECLQHFAVDHHSGRQRRDGKVCGAGEDFGPPRYGVNQDLCAQPLVGRRRDPMRLHDAEPGSNRSRHRPHRFEHDS